MAQTKVKQRFEKALKDEYETRQKLEQVTEQREKLQTELYADLGKRLMKQLGTQDIDTIEAFVNRLTPDDLVKGVNTENDEVASSVGEGVNYGH